LWPIGAQGQEVLTNSKDVGIEDVGEALGKTLKLSMHKYHEMHWDSNNSPIDITSTMILRKVIP
jgi:hypothetical protein